MPKWEGCFAILVSPITKEGAPDPHGLKALIDFVIEHGVNAVVLMGSTGEFPYFSQRERRRLIDLAVDSTNGRVPLIAGTSCIGTDETIELSLYAQDAGVDAVIVAKPTYQFSYRPRKEDILAHYRPIAEAIEKPLFLYNIPSTTHVEILPDIVIELSYLDNVAGIKESIGDMKQVEAVVKGAKKGFATMTGSSSYLLEVLKMGGAGTMCPRLCFFPEPIIEMYRAYKRGDVATAEAMLTRLKELDKITQGVQSGVAARKYLTRLRGVPIEPFVRRPQPQLTEMEKEQLQEGMRKAGLLNT